MSEIRTLCTVRLFADNHQFYVYDTSKDPFEPMPDIGDLESRRGWTRNENSIWYFTVGEFNDHRLDIYLAAVYEDISGVERLLAHNLTIESGSFAVYDHEEEGSVEVPAGNYTVYLRAYHLGEESEDELEDEEILQRDDLERYEIVLVPGTVEAEGVIAGNPHLY